MNEKEQLEYLIKGLQKGYYNIEDFCSEFVRIFNLEIDYDVLNADEELEYADLSDMAARFSGDSDELIMPNVYFSEEQIRKKVGNIAKKFNII